MSGATVAESTLTGGCLCGAAQYTIQGTALRFYHCHCSRCRKASGTGHASNLFIKGSLKWDSGEELVRTFKLPAAERFSNTFCTLCGGRLPRFIEGQGMVFLPAGSLDQEPAISPQARIFVGSRADWSCEEGPIPEFKDYPS